MSLFIQDVLVVLSWKMLEQPASLQTAVLPKDGIFMWGICMLKLRIGESKQLEAACSFVIFSATETSQWVSSNSPLDGRGVASCPFAKWFSTACILCLQTRSYSWRMQ